MTGGDDVDNIVDVEADFGVDLDGDGNVGPVDLEPLSTLIGTFDSATDSFYFRDMADLEVIPFIEEQALIARAVRSASSLDEDEFDVAAPDAAVFDVPMTQTYDL